MSDKQKIIDSSYESIVKQASQVKKPVYRFSKVYPAYIVLLLSLSISFGAWYFVSQKVKTDQYSAFDKAVTSVSTRLEQKYKDDQFVLKSMRGLYDTYIQVVRDVFELYGSIPIKSYTSIMTVLYCPRVYNEEFEAYIHYVRSEGYYDYKLHPAGQRQLYYPIEYVVPFEKNIDRSGYDLATDDIIKTAIEKSRDSNIIVSTRIFDIRKPDTTGFYIISPVFKKDAPIISIQDRKRNFQGSLLLEINSSLFFRQAIGKGVASDTSIIFQLVDIDEEGKEFPVYSSENIGLLKDNKHSDLKVEKFLSVADRNLKIKYYSIPNFGGTFQKTLPLLTLIITGLISFALFGFVLSLSTRKTLAIDYAERMTRAQRRIVEASHDIIAVMDMNGVWKSMNPASQSIFGYNPGELIGKKIDSLFQNPTEMKHFYSKIESTRDELTERLDTQIVARNQEIKWIDWSLTVSKTDELIYCIGRDITLEKIAEEQEKLRQKQNQLAEQLTIEISEFKTYFMRKLSHQLRNSLTGILGYLQLLSQKIYDNEEEHDNFVNLAEQTSEELFTFISDIDDVASGKEESAISEINLLRIENIIIQSMEKILNNPSQETKIEVETSEEGKNATVVASEKLLTNIFSGLFTSLSEGMESCKINVHAFENQFEGITEIQITSPNNSTVEKLINDYNHSLTNIIEALKFDKNDVIFRFAFANSNIKMMNGTMKIETFGKDEGNIIMINLPLSKSQD